MSTIEQDCKSRLHASDAAPGVVEITRLHFGRGRRVIRSDYVDGARQKLRPQAVLLALFSQRRGALGDCSEPLEVFFREIEVVGTSLNRNINAARAGFGGNDNAASGADMDDVELRFRLAREPGGPLDRLCFGHDRARVEESANAEAILFEHFVAKRLGQLLTLSMDSDRQPESRSLAQTFEQCEVVGAREFGKARVAHEGLESDDASRG